MTLAGRVRRYSCAIRCTDYRGTSNRTATLNVTSCDRSAGDGNSRSKKTHPDAITLPVGSTPTILWESIQDVWRLADLREHTGL